MKECAIVWAISRWPFLCVRTDFPRVCVEVVYKEKGNAATWLRALILTHGLLLCVCRLLRLQNATRIASLSLYLPPFIFFSLPSWSFGLPPPFLPLREASAAPPEASPGSAPIGRGQPHGLSGLPSSTPYPGLRVFQWNNSTAAVGEERGAGKERESPQWTWLTYSSISFVSFKLVTSIFKLFLHTPVVYKMLEVWAVPKWLSGCQVVVFFLTFGF